MTASSNAHPVPAPPRAAPTERTDRARHGLSRSLVTLLLCSWFAAATVSLIACSRGGSGGGDSESHFLSECTAECAEGLSCICGVCTLPCAQDSECDSLPANTRCEAPDSQCEAESRCDLRCDDGADCASLGAGYQCTAGSCRALEGSIDAAQPSDGAEDSLSQPSGSAEIPAPTDPAEAGAANMPATDAMAPDATTRADVPDPSAPDAAVDADADPADDGGGPPSDGDAAPEGAPSGAFVGSDAGPPPSEELVALYDTVLVPSCGGGSCHMPGTNESSYFGFAPALQMPDPATARAALVDQRTVCMMYPEYDLIRVVPFDPESSAIMLANADGLCGRRHNAVLPPSFTEAELAMIERWIANGAR